MVYSRENASIFQTRCLKLQNSCWEHTYIISITPISMGHELINENALLLSTHHYGYQYHQIIGVTKSSASYAARQTIKMYRLVCLAFQITVLL